VIDSDYFQQKGERQSNNHSTFVGNTKQLPESNSSNDYLPGRDAQSKIRLFCQEKI
jgi:hypothetical protein